VRKTSVRLTVVLMGAFFLFVGCERQAGERAGGDHNTPAAGPGAAPTASPATAPAGGGPATKAAPSHEAPKGEGNSPASPAPSKPAGGTPGAS
jgi:hypothetical protein